MNYTLLVGCILIIALFLSALVYQRMWFDRDYCIKERIGCSWHVGNSSADRFNYCECV